MIMAMIISVAVHFSVTASNFQSMPQSVEKRRFYQNVEKMSRFPKIFQFYKILILKFLQKSGYN